MKRQILTSVLTLLSIFLILSSFSVAQEEGNYYTVTTWKFEVPEDGSNTELNSLLQEWYDKVVSKNNKIISERVLGHQSGSDMRDWVFISEYASWNDIEAANEVQSKLIEEGWPDKEERGKYFDTFWKYAVTHSDEIFQEVPTLRK